MLEITPSAPRGQFHVVAAFLGWTLDAFAYFFMVFTHIPEMNSFQRNSGSDGSRR